MKKLFAIAFLAASLAACTGGETKEEATPATEAPAAAPEAAPAPEAPAAAPDSAAPAAAPAAEATAPAAK